MWYLIVAILFETLASLAIKESAINNDYRFMALSAIGYTISFTLLWITCKKMDISTAYAIWAGVGTALIVTGGVVFFNEPISILKMVFITMIIVSVIGLNLI
ncbi:MAG: multidrug efflux SMR transporter [Campylobacterota bacterium]|nr:multidrug efflux SMR transporter [Campylobacterota bacterium]